MDGNGRWAQSKGMNRAYGHERGAQKAFEIIDTVSQTAIRTLSLFVFSTENWQRAELEVRLLMQLVARAIAERKEFLEERQIRVHILGDRTGLPADTKAAVSLAEASTRDHTGLRLCIALNYSGQQDICQAANQLLRSGIHHFEPTLLERNLQTAPFGPPDLIIRTGGESRLSNFFLWQAAYAEIHFQKKLWPDFQIEDLQGHLSTFTTTERRFGLTSRQMA